MLERRIPPAQLMNLALRALPRETEEQNIQLMLGYLGGTYWLFLSEQERHAFSAGVETALRKGLTDAKGTSLKAAYFSALRRITETPDGVQLLENVWRKRTAVPGLTFAEADYTAMALELAVRDVPAAREILAEQLGRITNPDRKDRLAFITPAVSGDEATRDRFFASLADPANRRHEPWVIDAMAYLNHPLRAGRAERYIRPSLDLLRDIQRTGDIFFPTRWTDAALSGHHSPGAADIVRDFLASQEDYPLRLRQIIQQEADMLFRASEIVSSKVKG
jgi:aminopeptidase N